MTELPRRSRTASLVTRPMAVLLLLATACSAGSGAPLGGTTASGVSDEGPASLTFSADADAAATGTVTLEAGGTISATSAEGTTYELAVPPAAVPGDTEITLTPLTDVGGIEADGVHAVLLEPDGLELHELARLTITPTQPIPIESQLMIEAEHDGSDPGLALFDPSSEPIVLLLEHFSVAGVATASEAQRARLLEKSAANAEQRLNSRVRERIGAERYRQLASGEEVLGVDREALNEIAEEFQREVLDKRRAAAAESCRALRAYVRSVISWERQLQLIGLTEAEEAASTERVVEAIAYAESRAEECEKEAIAACQEADDPQILIDFWLWMEKTIDKARAERLCRPQDYKIDKTVTGSAGSSTWEIVYTATKCGGIEGKWEIDSSGTMSGEPPATIGGPLIVEIPPGETVGTLEGTADFHHEVNGTTQGRFTGTATVTEDPPVLVLEVTSGTHSRGNGYTHGFLDTGGMFSPGTLTLPLTPGDFC